MSLISILKSELNHIPGWHTRKKIVVIESDDWGTIRMPSYSVYDRLLKAGIAVDNDPYTRFDALESDDDLMGLFEVLAQNKNAKGQSPVLTANTILANPDFERIAYKDKQQYFFEPFTDTLKRYPSHSQVLSLYRQGMESRIFRPQLHGREHLNIHQWLFALNDQDPNIVRGFQEQTFAISPAKKYNKRNNFMSALDYETEEQKNDLAQILSDGAMLFQDTFGFVSKSFIAPTYVWDDTVETFLKKNGVDFIQGISYQYQPNPNKEWYTPRYRYTGKRNHLGQIYLTRNCFFEPTLMPDIDAVDQCLSRIRTAFRWNKPAIIGSHRLNYIGFIDPSNRDRNLKSFDRLLKSIIKTWPDVIFMSSDELGVAISD